MVDLPSVENVATLAVAVVPTSAAAVGEAHAAVEQHARPRDLQGR